jgi:hypothetical protein
MDGYRLRRSRMRRSANSANSSLSDKEHSQVLLRLASADAVQLHHRVLDILQRAEDRRTADTGLGSSPNIPEMLRACWGRWSLARNLLLAYEQRSKLRCTRSWLIRISMAKAIHDHKTSCGL